MSPTNAASSSGAGGPESNGANMGISDSNGGATGGKKANLVSAGRSRWRMMCVENAFMNRTGSNLPWACDGSSTFPSFQAPFVPAGFQHELAVGFMVRRGHAFGATSDLDGIGIHHPDALEDFRNPSSKRLSKHHRIAASQ